MQIFLLGPQEMALIQYPVASVCVNESKKVMTAIMGREFVPELHLSRALRVRKWAENPRGGRIMV
jgi:hypothetical protein